MKKRLKGLLVLWLALLMVVSMPMTANAEVLGVYFYTGSKALNAGDSYPDAKSDVPNNNFTSLISASDFAVNSQLDTILENNEIAINSPTGYSFNGWKFWNGDSGGKVRNPELKEGNNYMITQNDYDKYVNPPENLYLSYMIIEPTWKLDYEIENQPETTAPFVGLNDAGKTATGTTYQWYHVIEGDIIDFLPVSGAQYEGSGTWTADEGVMRLDVSDLPVGTILQITPSDTKITIEDQGHILSLSENANGDWICVVNNNITSDFTSFSIVNTNNGPFTVKINAFQPVEDQISATYSGVNGDCLCKVSFTNGASLYSNSFTYTAYDITANQVTNGSYSLEVDGQKVTRAIPGAQVTVVATPDEGYVLDSIAVTPDNPDGSVNQPNIEFKDATTFIMPYCAVAVDVTFKHKPQEITLPQVQLGYKVTSSQASPVEYGSNYTFKVTVNEGYDVLTGLSVKANGTPLVATSVNGKEYTYTLEKVVAAQEITVSGVSDITAPELTITLDEANSWKKFLPKVIFDLFFKEDKSLTITSTDAGSGIRSVMYYVSETDLFPNEEDYTSHDIENKIPQWTEYTTAVSISGDNSYVVYAKATDVVGNVTYVSTSGIVIDATAPVISGLEDGGQYYGDTSATISDANLSTVKLDGKAVEFTGTSASVTISADGAEHTIEATDKADNQVTYKVRVNETWVRDGISTAGPRSLKIGVPYKFGSGKWKVAGDTTVYEGGNTFYASEDGTFDFQSQ